MLTFPQERLRGIGNSVATTANWLFNFLTAAVFLPATQSDAGIVVTYSVLALSCFATYAFVRRFVPETKDLPNAECVRLVLEFRHGKRAPVAVGLTSPLRDGSKEERNML